jgi:HlyD family secretion protein
MKKKKLTIIVLAAAILILIAFMLIRGNSSLSGETAQVKTGKIQNTIEETGIVFSKRVNTFYSDISQNVESVKFSVGDKVKKGDIILTYENDYDLEIEKANKEMESITALYNEASKGTDFRQISNEKLTINTIENNLERARRSLEKLKSLYENSAISKAEVEEAENNVMVLENQLQEAKNNYDILLQGVSSNIKRQYEAQIEEIMVQIQILEKNRERSSVIAEFDGVITELNVHEGTMTQPGVVVAEIQDENNLGVYVEVLAEEAASIAKGMKFIVNQGIMKSEKELTVDRIYPKAETVISDLGVEQKRVRVEAYLKDLGENGEFKIGSETDAVIILEEKDGVLIVDKDAVYEKEGKKFVELKSGKSTKETEVITGIEDDENIEIISGLEENDVVVIEY